MGHIKNIKIENFRGFDKLEISNFGQINLIVGRNNCGKSSLLESIFLSIGMSNPLLPRFLGVNIKNEFTFINSGPRVPK